MLFAARSAGTVALRGLSRQPPATLRQPARRMMGGGGHSPAPHPSQPKQAFLFNEGPGPRKVEIWEPITSIVYWSTLFILVIGLSSAPETRIKLRAKLATMMRPFSNLFGPLSSCMSVKEWAAEEAETRLARIEEGKDVEYGKIYHKQLLTGGFVEHTALNADNPPEELEGEEED